MTETLERLPPDVWLMQLFSPRTLRDGGIVQRPVAEVDRTVGRGAFEYELRRRGFHAVENAGHYVIFCNADPLRVLC